MAANKTVETDADVGAFLASVEGDGRRADAATLVALMSRLTGQPPKLWGSIIGFGRYHYKYASGHEGDACLVGFSPRKAEFSIYLIGGYHPDTADRSAALLARLGKHRMGKACLYVKTLDAIDLDVLAELIELSVMRLQQDYGMA